MDIYISRDRSLIKIKREKVFLILVKMNGFNFDILALLMDFKEYVQISVVILL